MAQGVEALNGSREQAEGSAPKQLGPAGFLPRGNCTLHHLGFVVASIAAVAEDFAFSISAHWDGEITHDPIQRVRVTFLTPLDLRNPVYELIEPASEASPVSNFLKKRGGL